MHRQKILDTLLEFSYCSSYERLTSIKDKEIEGITTMTKEDIKWQADK